ncbi:MAG: nucleotidyltransferase family protein [Saprospiraceae bacterium]|nr:nucleotidyltransferase family protein [Saprospiraceae bacterium]
MSLTCIVLAAGLSRRMGVENKLLLPFGDKTIVETTIQQILNAQIGEVIVVVGYEAEKLNSIFKNYPLSHRSSPNSIVENPDYEQGMTTSIKAGVNAASISTKGYMICLSDMVLIQPEEYRFLAERFFEILETDEMAIVQPVFKGERGNPVLFSHFYKKDILETVDTEGCRSVVQAHKNHLYLVEMPSQHILQDIDFQEDYTVLIAQNTPLSKKS